MRKGRHCIGAASVLAAAAWFGIESPATVGADDALPTAVVVVPGPPWTRHTIDDSSRGADGVKLGDLNGDGRPDIATGWEEGGLVRVCLNPGSERASRRWPSVVVGRAENVEEAIFADLDGDGRPEVVSGAEGKTKTIYRHRFAGSGNDELLDRTRWITEPIPATAGMQLWMQAATADIDGRYGIDLVVGSKNQGAAIGWLEAPAAAGDLAAWRYHRLRPAGWIMSLIPQDLDGDGDTDVVFSDRIGKQSGVAWLENPGPEANREGKIWSEHAIAAAGRNVMFADVGDVNGDGRFDVAAAVKPAEIVVALQRPAGRWEERVIGLDQTNLGDAKAVKLADFDGDGLTDIVFSCEHADGPREGIVWLRRQAAGPWEQRTLGGPDGLKFDLMQAVDLDADGDLDVLACEERDQLGVIWYENPHRRRD